MSNNWYILLSRIIVRRNGDCGKDIHDTLQAGQGQKIMNISENIKKTTWYPDVNNDSAAESFDVAHCNICKRDLDS